MKSQEETFRNLNQDVIDGCKKGDSKAQFQLYKLYYRNMYNTCLRILNDSAEAEDVMQEAFLSAFEKINTYEGKVSFGSWLKRIVVNRSLDALRKRKIDLIDIDEKTGPAANEDQVNEEEIEYKVQKVKDAIKQLPDGYRLVLTLYLFEGYDHDEIAEILNISASTSRSQYTRARQKLLKIMQ
jgi:RNA polymerase sigma-70 factor (ECF subfamily)